jgi:hypothetical protein
MRPVHLSLALLFLANLAVWLVVLMWRLPYLGQIPVFDFDVTTSAAAMWARNWWIEGGTKIWFALPYSPLSVETPTLEARHLYQSWPPGAFFPVYWLALLLNIEPNVVLVNWLNAITHGLLALFLSLAAFVLCRLNGMGLPGSTVIATSVIGPVLMQRGPVYIFSQIYCHTTHSIVYMAAFLLLECLYHRAGTQKEKDLVLACQLGLMFCAFLVDWLSFFVYGFWMLLRVAGVRLGYFPKLRARTAIVTAALPLLAFGIYLVWRFATPGSLARTQGLRASLTELAWKVVYRMGYADQHPLSQARFLPILADMHTNYFSDVALPLIIASFLASVVLTALAWHIGWADQARRRTVYTTNTIMLLSVVPFYAQIFFFAQHSAIHPFAIAKVVIPFAMLPFVFVPLALRSLALAVGDRLGVGHRSIVPGSARWFVGIAALATVLVGSIQVARRHDRPYLIGRIDPETYRMWDAIRRNSAYRDVVFSPVLEAEPISVRVGVAGKLVYPAHGFSDIDQRVRRVCGPFNVLVVLKGSDAAGFSGRKPDRVLDDSGLTFLRYENYPGAAKGCS